MAKCKTKYCRKPRAKNSLACHSCNKRLYAERHPEKYAYNNLKQNAKRRGKVFELTFEQFEQFAIDTLYMTGKGISKDSMHIDRIDPEKGYCIENIRVLSNTENVQRHRKFLKHGFDDHGVPNSFHVEPENDIGTFDDVPF